MGVNRSMVIGTVTINPKVEGNFSNARLIIHLKDTAQAGSTVSSIYLSNNSLSENNAYNGLYLLYQSEIRWIELYTGFDHKVLLAEKFSSAPPEGANVYVVSLVGITAGRKSLSLNDYNLVLEGDSINPGADKYYGTDLDGNKTWKPVLVVDGGGASS